MTLKDVDAERREQQVSSRLAFFKRSKRSLRNSLVHSESLERSVNRRKDVLRREESSEEVRSSRRKKKPDERRVATHLPTQSVLVRERIVSLGSSSKLSSRGRVNDEEALGEDHELLSRDGVLLNRSPDDPLGGSVAAGEEEGTLALVLWR